MRIWKNPTNIDFINAISDNTMASFMEIEVTEVGDDYIKAKMPVTAKTAQPYRYLHGGASVALAETLGSIASALCVDHTAFICLGQEINANHIRSAKEGQTVWATATPLHIGKSSHVWDIKITDEAEKLVCVSRLTVVVIPRK
ncbi:MAG: hotdog fold thioesterase [Chitinophagales bacterium]|nr:hotdog fold thioesterase [Bacteroidota bacterium]MCB9044054.1 hotdog fold thioesterase [Chitinophagales bacterium]